MNLVQAARRSFRAELVKLWRPSTLVGMGVLTVLSVLSAVLIVSLADEPGTLPGDGPAGFNTTTDQLAAASGVARGFTGGSTFAGLLVFLVFAIMMTLEYSQGTVRTVFVREPRRVGWLIGRLAVLLTLVAVALVAALALSVTAATIVAGIRGIDTSAWWSSDGASALASGYGNVLLSSALFAIAGTVLGLVLRSTALALAVGVAWMFPLEHIVQGTWRDASHVLPGLVFDAVAQGGVPNASYQTALTIGLVYATVVAALGAIVLTRRDVTA